MGTTKLENIGVDDPILGWVGGPRGTGDLKTWDSTWVRLVDLEAAWPLRSLRGRLRRRGRGRGPLRPLERRSLAAHRLVWVGTAPRTDAEADVTLDVNVLGAGYLGHPDRRAAARGPRRASTAPGAYAELARAHAHPRRAGAVDRLLSRRR